MQAARIGAHRSAQLSHGRFAATRGRQRIQRSRYERIVARDSDAAEQRIQVGAGHVATEGNARGMRTQLTGAFTAGITGRGTDPKQWHLPPGAVAPTPGNWAGIRLTIGEAARLAQPLVGEAIRM